MGWSPNEAATELIFRDSAHTLDDGSKAKTTSSLRVLASVVARIKDNKGFEDGKRFSKDKYEFESGQSRHRTIEADRTLNGILALANAEQDVAQRVFIFAQSMAVPILAGITTAHDAWKLTLHRARWCWNPGINAHSRQEYAQYVSKP